MTQLCEQLLLLYPEKLNGKATPIHRAIIYCLTVPPSGVRRKCATVVKKLVQGLGGTIIARSLLKELMRFYETAKIQVSLFCIHFNLKINNNKFIYFYLVIKTFFYDRICSGLELKKILLHFNPQIPQNKDFSVIIFQKEKNIM